MREQVRQDRWAGGRGLAGSLLLHGLVLLLWLNWSLAHPVPEPAPLKALLVDLVAMPMIALMILIFRRDLMGAFLPGATIRMISVLGTVVVLGLNMVLLVQLAGV